MYKKYLSFPFIFIACAFFSTKGISNFDIGAESNILIQFNEPYEVCFNQQVLITPTVTGGSGGYTYMWSNGEVGPSTNAPQAPNSLAAGTYQYMLTVTDAAGCSEVASVNYTILQEVTHTLFSNTDFVCLDGVTENIEVCAVIGTGLQNGPFIYDWNIDAGLDFTVNNNCVFIDDENSQAGFYQISLGVTDIFGCTYEEGPIFITIQELPAIGILPQDCNPNASGPTEHFIHVCEVNSDQVVWNLYDESCTVLLSGPVDGNCATFAVSPFNQGDTEPVEFCVQAQDLSSGCSSFVSIEVAPEKIPDVPQSISGCVGETVELILGNPEDFLAWQWCDGVSSDTSFQITLTGNETCFLNVFDIAGCEQAFEIEIITFLSEEVNISGATNFCAGSSTTLCATSNPNYQYNWSTGETTDCITISTAGNYTVEVFEDFCVSSISLNVEEVTNLNPIINGSDFCTGGTVVLTAGDFYATYEWRDSQDNIITPPDPTMPWLIAVSAGGIYSVFVTDGDCEGLAEIEIFEQAPPTATILDVSVCNSEAAGMSSILDLNTAVNDASGNVVFVTPEGNELMSSVVDFLDVDPGIYIYQAIVSGTFPCTATFFDVPVEVLDCTTSVDDIPALNIAVFPNPTSDLLHIDSEETGFTYQIMSMSGVIVQEGDSTEKAIQMESLDAGIYFVKFSLDDLTRVARVVRN